MNRIPITQPYIGEEETLAVKRVLESGWLVQGAKVKEFEQRVAEHEQVKFCCATTSCTTALHLAMLAEGMGEGMDVLVPSFTFVATANAVVSTGAIPILMDICEDTFNLDADLVEKYIKNNYVKHDFKLVNKKTGNILWGIVPVHQFGLCADMFKLNELAHKYGFKIVEDAACALGSKIGETHIGGFGNTACVSFHPRKSITTGEGGMVLTNDEEIYQKIVELRNHGSAVNSDTRHNGNGFLLPQYVSSGFNYRMTDMQGAIGCEQVAKLDYILEKRREVAKCYDELLGDESSLIIPYVPEGYYHTYQSYVCMLNLNSDLESDTIKRNNIMEGLEKLGIVTRQGTHAVHKLDYYRERFGIKKTELPIANRCDSLTISLPVYVTLLKEEQKIVVDSLLKLVQEIER